MISDYFSREEFKCKCGKCDFDTVDYVLLNILEDIRRHFGKPVTITSGCRCEKHNKAVGGAKNSQHTKGKAADIIVKDITPWEVASWLHNKYGERFGIGVYSGWVHVDSRDEYARWGGSLWMTAI